MIHPTKSSQQGFLPKQASTTLVFPSYRSTNFGLFSSMSSHSFYNEVVMQSSSPNPLFTYITANAIARSKMSLHPVFLYRKTSPCRDAIIVDRSRTEKCQLYCFGAQFAILSSTVQGLSFPFRIILITSKACGGGMP